MRWVEKYRPKTFDEIIGQDKVIKAIRKAVKNKDLPHMLFIGPPGTGKTTTATVIARELFGEAWKNHFVELNASDERGIDTIRTKIKTLSLTKRKLIIFLDEADALTPDAQHALRRIMEKTPSIFILSANYDYRIIDPIKSRCAVYVFEKLGEKDVARMLLKICKAEGIPLSDKNKKSLIEIVKSCKGDLRRAINTLQQSVDENKEIDLKTVVSQTPPKIASEALRTALAGNFSRAKELIQEAYLQVRDINLIIEELYQEIDNIKDDHIRANLLIRLATLEHRCRHLSNPVIQLVSFIAYAWVLPNIPKECPLRR